MAEITPIVEEREEDMFEVAHRSDFVDSSVLRHRVTTYPQIPNTVALFFCSSLFLFFVRATEAAMNYDIL